MGKCVVCARPVPMESGDVCMVERRLGSKRRVAQRKGGG